MIDLEEVINFFPTGSNVRAVPNFVNPKLIVEDRGLFSRWNASSLFPATRLTAKVLKELKRLQLGAGVMGTTKQISSKYLLEPLVKNRFPNGLIQILLGTNGPAQKAIVRIVNATDGRIEAFIKYGSSHIAQERIKQEYDVLSQLPVGLGPKPMQIEELGSGLALMISSLEGVQPNANLPPQKKIVEYLNSLETSDFQTVTENPILMDLKGYSAFPFVLDILSKKKWKKVFSHGDFAPWNLRIVDHKVQAFDWEYGSLLGLPHLDLAFYVQQVGALINKWSSEKVRSVTQSTLLQFYPKLEEEEALAFTLLAAMRSYYESERDGHPSDFFIQPWRKAIWEGY